MNFLHQTYIDNLFADIKELKYERDDFDFGIVNFPLLDGDDLRTTSYVVYISQHIRFARASSHVTDLITLEINCLLRNKQGYEYHKLHKTFSKF